MNLNSILKLQANTSKIHARTYDQRSLNEDATDGTREKIRSVTHTFAISKS